MTYHKSVAEGDRHPPIDRTFSTSSVRLAYTYVADDVGKWYMDDDTGGVFQLTATTPTFRQMIGGDLYSYPFDVLSVDAASPDADYSTIAAAIAAASSGDVIQVGPGSYTCDNQTLPAGVDLVGFGIGVTVLTTTGTTALTTGTGSIVQDLTIQSTVSGNSIPVVSAGAGSQFYSVESISNDTGGASDAIPFKITANTKLTDCIGTVTAGGQGYGVYVEGTGIYCHIVGGVYDSLGNGGDLYAAGKEALYLSYPELLIGSITAAAAEGVFNRRTLDGSIKQTGFSFPTGSPIYEFDTDETFAGRSDYSVPTQQAVAEYIEGNRLYRRQGGSSTDFSAAGTNSYNDSKVIMQAGVIEWTGAAAVTGSIAVTFPTAFANTPMVMISIINEQAASMVMSASADGITASGFTAYWSKTSVTVTSFQMAWLAIGPS